MSHDYKSNSSFDAKNTHLITGSSMNINSELVPKVQNMKIRQIAISCLLRVSIVKRLVCLDASGTNGLKKKSMNSEKKSSANR